MLIAFSLQDFKSFKEAKLPLGVCRSIGHRNEVVAG